MNSQKCIDLGWCSKSHLMTWFLDTICPKFDSACHLVEYILLDGKKYHAEKSQKYLLITINCSINLILTQKWLKNTKFWNFWMILTLSLTVLVTSIPAFDILRNTELEKHLIYSQLFRFSGQKLLLSAENVIFEQNLQTGTLFTEKAGFRRPWRYCEQIFVSVTVYMF